MNSAVRVGFRKYATWSSFLSILSGVLFRESHTTLYPVSPLLPIISDRNELLMLVTSSLVISSLGSKMYCRRKLIALFLM